MNDMTIPVITNELDVLETPVPLADVRIVDAGCGAAHLARELVSRHPATELVGIEVDARQLAKKLQTPVERLRFQRAGAQAIPFPDASFDGALMRKSLHHVPVPLMEQALADQRFAPPFAFAGFDEFKQRMMRPTFADHDIDAAMAERVRLRYLPHQGPVSARFTRPMHVRLLRKTC